MPQLLISLHPRKVPFSLESTGGWSNTPTVLSEVPLCHQSWDGLSQIASKCRIHVGSE